MAKSKINLKLIVGIVALVLGVVAFIMMFSAAVVPASEYASKDDFIKGSQIAFGAKIEGTDQNMLNFNPIALLAFVLPLVGGILAFVGKNKKGLSIVSAILFIVGAVLLFLMVSLLPIGGAKIEMYGHVVADYGAMFKEAVAEGLYKLGSGAVIGAILSIIGAAGAVCNAFVFKD